MERKNIMRILEAVTPILIKPTYSSLTIGISKRFFLFNVMRKLVRVMEDDPYLNFISLIKSYKLLGRFLHGTLYEIYRDRNKLYFKNFFVDRELYAMVKADIESLYPAYKELKLTITKRGLIVYDNYKKNAFNVLLMTIHSGSWVPANIKKKLRISEHKRHIEEDTATDRLYRKIVLRKGGIWIDNKQSRFVIDFNRNLSNAIYSDNSESFIGRIWRENPAEREVKDIYRSHREFYFVLSRLVESYRFNIIFDGHSMRGLEGRPNISFGTKFIPEFYMPIVRSMQKRMIRLGYSPVLLNTPYSGGYILRWLSQQFPSLFIFSMEINKKLYVNSRNRIKKRMLNRIAGELPAIFDINEGDDE